MGRFRRELFVTIVVALFYVAFAWLDVFEGLNDWIRRHEGLELDEVFVLLPLALMLAIVFLIIKQRELFRINRAYKREIEEHQETSRKLQEHQAIVLRAEKMESIALMASGVAHDLNNILAGIVCYPDQVLSDIPLDDEVRKAIEVMQESGTKASAIVSDLLAVARGQSTVLEPIELNAVIEAYLAAPHHLELVHAHPHVSIIRSLSSNELPVLGSALHIEKLVMNLVTNAVEAMTEVGGVVITTARRDNGAAVLIVTDSGPGIPLEDQRRVFEPFYTRKKLGRSGTGLGLTIVWNVVRDHDADIKVESDSGGTSFEITFPPVPG